MIVLVIKAEGYHHAKQNFADLGKALSCLLHSSILATPFVISILCSLFDNFIPGTDNQGKFSCPSPSPVL